MSQMDLIAAFSDCLLLNDRPLFFPFVERGMG